MRRVNFQRTPIVVIHKALATIYWNMVEMVPNNHQNERKRERKKHTTEKERENHCNMYRSHWGVRCRYCFYAQIPSSTEHKRKSMRYCYFFGYWALPNSLSSSDSCIHIKIVEAICDVTWRQRTITSLLLACYKNVNSTYAYNVCALDVKRLQSVSLFFCIAIVIVYSTYYVY